MNARLLAELELKITEWANDSAGLLEVEWEKALSKKNHMVYYSDDTAILMAVAAAAVFDAMTSGQFFAHEEDE